MTRRLVGPLCAVLVGVSLFVAPSTGGIARAWGYGGSSARQAAQSTVLPDGAGWRTVLSRTGFTAFEPTLGVTERGGIFFQAAHMADTPARGLWPFHSPDVIRSEDWGRSWQRSSPTAADRDLHVFTSDPFLHVDTDTGRIFTMDWVSGTYCSEISYSDTHGDSWQSTTIGCAGSDREHLFTGPARVSPTPIYPNVVYFCAQSIPSAICSKSLDGGRTFSPTGAAPFAEITRILDCGRIPGHGVVAPDGTIYIPTACEKPYLAISKDEGASWDVVAVSDRGTDGYQASSVGVDGEGNLYYLWMGEDRLPYLTISKDGRSWSRPRSIAAPGVKEASLGTVAVTADGGLAAAYFGTTATHPDGDYEGVPWNGYISITDDASRARPTFVSGSFGTAEDPLARGECGPNRCLSAFDFIDVVIDRHGGAWASFVDSCDKDSCLSYHAGPAEFGEGMVAGLVPRRHPARP